MASDQKPLTMRVELKGVPVELWRKVRSAAVFNGEPANAWVFDALRRKLAATRPKV